MIYDLSRIMTTITMLQCTMKTQARSQKPRQNLKGDQKLKRNKMNRRQNGEEMKKKLIKKARKLYFR